MKKVKNLLVLLVLVVLVLCGCEKGKNSGADETSSSKEFDLHSSILATSNRKTKDFESLVNTIILEKEENGYYYRVTLYGKDKKVVNVVVDIICPDEDTAISLLTSVYNNTITEEAVRNGNYVSYDYKEGKCDFFDKEMDTAFLDYINRGYKHLLIPADESYSNNG